MKSESYSHSVVSDSLQPHGLQPARLLCPWDCPGKNAGVGCHFLLQGIFSTQGSNPGLLHCRQILHHFSHQGIPNTSTSKYETAALFPITNLASPFLPPWSQSLASSVSAILDTYRRLYQLSGLPGATHHMPFHFFSSCTISWWFLRCLSIKPIGFTSLQSYLK